MTRQADAANTGVEHGHLCWRARSVLEDAGVLFEDERVSYVEIQVDRKAWLAWLEAVDAES